MSKTKRKSHCKPKTALIKIIQHNTQINWNGVVELLENKLRHPKVHTDRE